MSLEGNIILQHCRQWTFRERRGARGRCRDSDKSLNSAADVEGNLTGRSLNPTVASQHASSSYVMTHLHALSNAEHEPFTIRIRLLQQANLTRWHWHRQLVITSLDSIKAPPGSNLLFPSLQHLPFIQPPSWHLSHQVSSIQHAILIAIIVRRYHF